MNPIIGIISRKDISKKKHNISYVYDDIISSVIRSKGIPIGINGNNINMYLDICDGFILQGGDDILEEDLKIIKLLHEKNVPLLGICLGMQEMAYLFKGRLNDVLGHNDNSLHEIEIKKDTLLSKILSCHKTIVNTRHKDIVTNTDLTVNATSSDGIIEGVEDTSKKFFLGVQWHPENMTNIDINSKKLFDYFVLACRHK